MAAPLGNKYAKTWNKEIALELINEVRKQIEKGKFYHIGSAAIRALESIRKKYTQIRVTRDHVWDYLKKIFSNDQEVIGSIKYVESFAESKIVENSLNGDIKSAAMAIFYLKNKHGYTDKVQQDFNIQGSVGIEKWIENNKE